MKTLLLATALAVAVAVPARADGLLVPPPPTLWSLPVPGVQGPPTQSCIETAIQLAYQTGSRAVGNAAAAACAYYAPVRFPQPYYGPPPLSGYPPGPPR
jgi:hypothetical protein